MGGLSKRLSKTFVRELTGSKRFFRELTEEGSRKPRKTSRTNETYGFQRKTIKIISMTSKIKVVEPK